MAETTNFTKHTNSNPIQQYLIGRFYKQIFFLLKPLKIETILDAGCGEGFTLVKLQRAKIGKRVQGIDNSSDAIKLAKKHYPTLPIEKGSIYDLPYEDSSYDLVIATEVLEHLDDPEKALNEVKRVASKYVLLTVPNEPLFTIANFLRGKYLKNLGNHPEHINHWSKRKFRNFVKKSGLRVSTVKTPFPWTVVLAKKNGANGNLK